MHTATPEPVISDPGLLIYSFIHGALPASCFGARHRGCAPAGSPRAAMGMPVGTSDVRHAKSVADVNGWNNYKSGSLRKGLRPLWPGHAIWNF